MDPVPSPSWAPHLAHRAEGVQVASVGSGGLTARWVARWLVEPDRPVLHLDDEGWLTAGVLETRTRLRAGGLAAHGLASGHRILLRGDVTTELLVTHLAALRLGAVVVPVNPAYREREIGHLVTVARPGLAVMADPDAADAVDQAGGVNVRTVALDCVGDVEPIGPIDQAAPGDPALMVFTSGTTGAPKGVPLTHANLLAGAEAVGLAWRWSPSDRLVLALPLFHLHGLAVGLYGTLTAGASAVLHPAFDAGAVLDAVVDHDATLFFGVPTMYRRLLDSGRAGELGRLRLCVSGSAPLAPEVHAAVEAVSGQIVLERYGMSETVMLVSNPYEGERRSGTVGFPLPGVELRLAPGSDEILVRGPNVFAGYWERPDATAEAFDADGWFATGDIGRFDDDGYLRIVGRSKDLIITGGYNVYPREVEDVLRSIVGVVDVAVAGAPDADWGEVVVAYVEGDADPADLAAVAANELAPYKRPRRIHQVAHLPRNALGKVVKGDLSEP